MSTNSKIEWTDATWNPVTGCTKISPGCANCYIERTPAFRIKGRKFEHGRIPIELHPERLGQPLHWRKPKRVFVNSLSDLFHEDVPEDFIVKVFAVMALSGNHRFQLLTKRPERMLAFVTWLSKSINPLEAAAREMGFTFNFQGFSLLPWPIRNVWLGVSVEDQQRADERIPLLLQTPAAVRFLSCEPLLADLQLWALSDGSWYDREGAQLYDCLKGTAFYRSGEHGLSGGPTVDWVIVGGESGHGARPCDIAWIRSIVEQCQKAGVACFVKQFGSRPIDSGHKCRSHYPGHCGLCNGFHDKKGGNPSEWPDDFKVRQFPRMEATHAR